MMRNFLSVLSLLTLAGFLRAGTITGKVVGPLGSPVAGAEIRIKGVSFPTPPLTGPLGTFSVTVPPGTYDVGIVPGQHTLLIPVLFRKVKVLLTANLGTIQLKKGFKLTGTVLDPNKLPLFNADMNVYDQKTRVKLYTPDDNTDALGVYSIIVPAGTYRVRATPPVGKLLVAQEVNNVVVNKLTVLSPIVLPAGVLVTGRVVDQVTNQPIANADTDADDALTGKRIVTPNDNTDATGTFRMILAPGLYHINIDPPPGQPFPGRRIYNVQIATTTNLGVFSMPRGFVISGTVLGPGATPVAGCNLDLLTSPGDSSLYISNDATDATGKFQIAVPAGKYRLSVEPPNGSTLVGALSAPFTVSANMTLPTFNLAAGVPLSGKITAWNGGPEVKANLDVINPTTNDVLPTQNDTTDALGNYKIYVPTGTWNVRIKTKKLSFSQSVLFKSVAVTGAKVLNAKLNLVPVGVYFASIGVPTATRGGNVNATLVFVNMRPTIVNAKLSLGVIDPGGNPYYVIKPTTVALPPFYAVALGGLPFPVPMVGTGYLGGVHRYVFRADDPVSGAEFDRDGFQLVIK